MAGRIILGIANPALDANGKVDSGATLTFYKTGTTTLQSVYTDATLATPLANPLSPDAAGRFPAVWAATNQTFSVKWTPPGASAITYDNISPQPSLGDYLFDTLASAEAASMPSAATFIALAGFTAIGDAGEVLIYKRAVSAPLTHALYFQSADGAYWVYQPGINGVNGIAAGMSSSAADNSTAWGKLTTYQAQSPNKFIYLNIPEQAYNFTTGITWDPSIGGVRANGATFQFNVGANVTGFKVACSNPTDGSANYNQRSVCENLHIIGPSSSGTPSGTQGLWFIGGAHDTAQFSMRNLIVRGWVRAVQFDSSAYLFDIRNIAISECVAGFQDNASASNAGERIVIDGFKIAGCGSYAIDLGFANADYRFSNGSVDLNCLGASTQPQMRFLGTRATLDKIHAEAGANPALLVGKNVSTSGYVTAIDFLGVQTASGVAAPYIEVDDGGTLRLVGGQSVVNNSTTTALKVKSGGVVSRYGHDFLTTAAITNDAGSTYNNYP